MLNLHPIPEREDRPAVRAVGLALTCQRAPTKRGRRRPALGTLDQCRHHGVDAGGHPLARGAVGARRPRRQLRVDGRDGVVDLRVLRVHAVHQLLVEGCSLTQQRKEQLVLAGVVRVEEGQHLPGVRTDDLGSRTVTRRGAEQPR
ncbi:hypothetical protein OG446_29295 [Streptomyces sp. NBC_00236]|nr:hypothetical protein [Streptomyces sp. NBC_00236]